MSGNVNARLGAAVRRQERLATDSDAGSRRLRSTGPRYKRSLPMNVEPQRPPFADRLAVDPRSPHHGRPLLIKLKGTVEAFYK